MELEKIRNLTDDELTSQQTKSAEQLFRLRFQKSLGNNEGLKKLKTLKLDIARIKTIARQRELGIVTTVRAAKPAKVKAEAKTVAAKAPAAAKKTTAKKAKKD